jgi:hypothetical protein
MLAEWSVYIELKLMDNKLANITKIIVGFRMLAINKE